MNVGLYDAVVRWTELTGGTMDEGLVYAGFVWFVVIAVLGWAFGFTFDLGMTLYSGIKKLLRFILNSFQSKKKKEP